MKPNKRNYWKIRNADDVKAELKDLNYTYKQYVGALRAGNLNLAAAYAKAYNLTLKMIGGVSRHPSHGYLSMGKGNFRHYPTIEVIS